MNTDRPNPLKAAMFGALWAFLGAFFPALLDFTSAVYEWADSNGVAEFPEVSILGYAAVAALTSGFAFTLALVVRVGQEHGYLPGNAPTYATPPSLVVPNDSDDA